MIFDYTDGTADELGDFEENYPLEKYFDNGTCYACNGYYGPCFEDAVCATCHAFLFPNFVTTRELKFTEISVSDDGDSGNDEPADSPYPTPRDRNSPVPEEENEALAEQLQLLSDNSHALVSASSSDFDVEQLPPEVVLSLFVYLDEMSLWCVGNVCRRWQRLMRYYVNEERWRHFVQCHWPLFRPAFPVQDWFAVFTYLAKSCWCLKCMREMSTQAEAPGQENPWRMRRIMSELKHLRIDPPEGIQAKPLDCMWTHWQATISGPKGSPYEGGLFFLYLQIPYTYPMCPPIIRFLTKIFHPNVSRHGDIGIDFLHHTWTLALTVSTILISIQSLLTDPYCEICMEPDIGELYLHNRERFEDIAREWTWKYAMHDLFLNKSASLQLEILDQ